MHKSAEKQEMLTLWLTSYIDLIVCRLLALHTFEHKLKILFHYLMQQLNSTLNNTDMLYVGM